MMTRLFSLCCLLVLALPSWSQAAEYFVSLTGNDANDGLSRQKAFATIQKGVDALQPGDTLTIAPGEYFGGARRQGLGSSEAETRIRAEIPGTVVLHGDVPAPKFQKLDGYRYVYVADFSDEIHAISELDTLTVLGSAPNLDELEFTGGKFYHDLKAGKLYVSAPDLASVQERRYRIATTGTHGLYLRDAERVSVEGLAATGFHARSTLPTSEQTLGNAWGIIIIDGRNCVIRDCSAYFNGRGIATHSREETSGNNTIIRCVVWANASSAGVDTGGGPSGGLTLINGRKDVIRDSVAFRNGYKGINIRNSVSRGQDEKEASLMINNLAWGNPMDMRIKTGVKNLHRGERNVAMFPVESFNSFHNLFRRGLQSDHNSIVLNDEKNLDPAQEFADPEHYDYRLQANSRFRRVGSDSTEKGPFPYKPNIYYVSPGGDDAADGLSAATAWRTLQRAGEALTAGDTLYLEPGSYSGGLRLEKIRGALTPTGSHPVVPWETGGAIYIRGRGADWRKVTIEGPVELDGCEALRFERVRFTGDVRMRDSRDMEFRNVTFTGEGVPLQVKNTEGLRISHSEFTGFATAAIQLDESTKIYLTGNIFDNARSVAIRCDTASTFLYSDYNAYRDTERVWLVGEDNRTLAGLTPEFERYSKSLQPEYRRQDGKLLLVNSRDFQVGGPQGNPLGHFVPEEYLGRDTTLRVNGPSLHAVGATTANLEWWSSRPAVFRVRWGKTPEMGNQQILETQFAYGPRNTLEQFNTYSLVGLEPQTTYYFQVEFVRLADDPFSREKGSPNPEVQGLSATPVSFTTMERDPEPRTLYVSVNGDNRRSGLSREEAWRTISYAASQVRPGDTVLIGEGEYLERIRLRASGTKNARITFRGHPGEKAVLDGGSVLENAFWAAYQKNHIDFDGLYSRGYSAGRAHKGVFGLVKSNDIRVTRIFNSGSTGAPAAQLLTAAGTDGVLVKNCVAIRVWDTLTVGSSRNVTVENNVFVLPSIRLIGVGGKSEVRLSSNIITDNLAVKRHVNLFDGLREGSLENNAFFLRWPEEERSVFGHPGVVTTPGSKPENPGVFLAEYNRTHKLDRPNLIADPQFAVFRGAQEKANGLFNDRMLEKFQDFPDLFTTNPELIAKGIGLQPNAFADFHFRRTQKE